MGEQMFFLQQFLAVPWTAVALLVCLFVVLILRPERIQHRGLFRAACWLLSLSIVVPAALNTLIMLASFASNLARSGFGEGMGLFLVVHGSGPVLVGLGVLFGLLSLVPAWPAGTSSQPTRHPLE